MRTLTVSLGSRSYEILIGPGVLTSPELVQKALQCSRTFVVTNETVAPLYLGRLKETLRALSVATSEIILPDGEKHKNQITLETIYDRMLSTRCDRQTPVIALGGGVVGDMAGFAAATYQRGVPLLQIPTTLLAQVDSSVGGKTGINHRLGKNMIGAFWQPRLVLADTETLSTLPDRELAAGMAEVIKYGLIRDISLFEYIEKNIARLLARDPDALSLVIERSCANKAEVVAADEFETAKDGGRALLNLGHTFGHAIETAAGYGTWLHGEAVAAGTVMAARLSQRLGWLSEPDVERLIKVFSGFNLPVRGYDMTANEYMSLMVHDKKVRDGKLRLVLLKKIGEAVTHDGATAAEICAAIDDSSD